MIARRFRPLAAATLLLSVVPLVGPSAGASAAISPLAASGTVTGVVFDDKNGDGANAGGTEIGVAGAEVRAYDSTGALVSSPNPVLSGADGTYSLTITNAATDDLRVEFTTPTGYAPAPHGTDNGTSVQFVKVNDTGVDFGVLIPANFCADNVDQNLGSAVATCFYPGASSWTPGTFNRDSVKYTAWNAGNENVGSALAASASTGAVWGLGSQATTGLVFSSAVIRRHADLGPQGIGGIYVMRSGEKGVVESYDLATLYSAQGVQFTDNAAKWTRAARGIVTPGSLTDGSVANALSTDIVGWSGVGTEGIGDIDVSDDYQYLWVMNLYEKTLLRITLDGTRDNPNLGAMTEFALPTDICSLAGSNERPWAVDPQPDGTVRVGVVCDNAGAQDTSAELSLANKAEGAFVYSLTPGTSTWTQLLQVDLASRTRYDRLCGQTSGVANAMPEDGRCWGAWLGSWSNYSSPTLMGFLPQHVEGYAVYQYGQPMLVDIETLLDGSMVLSVNDRLSMQIGWKNEQPTNSPESVVEPESGATQYISAWVMGDAILACSTGASSWNVESGGTCSGTTTYTGTSIADDPGSSSPFGEFFRDNMQDAHFEVASAGLAVRPGASGIAVGVMDPCDIYQGGIRWYSTSNGVDGACAVFTGAGGELDTGVGFGKSSSMGDLEFLCDAAPIEIGNRIWIDSDADGIQDPGEAPIAGVTVNLYDSTGTLVGSAITNEFGEYYFTSTYGVEGDYDTSDNVGAGVLPYAAFTIKLDNPGDWEPGGVLDSTRNSLTLADQTAAAGISDAIDSDFTLVDGYPVMSVAPHAPGQSDHTFDAGIIRQVVVGVGDYTWIDSDQDGIQDPDESPLENVYVELLNPDGTAAVDAEGNPVAGVYTDAFGFYFFDNLLAGDYKIRFTLDEGYTFTTPSSEGSTSADDSNPVPTADPLVGVTPTFTIAPSATGDTEADVDDWWTADFINPTIDAGVIPPVVAVGNYTWFDSDEDGIQDAGESALPGVYVELFDENGDPAVDANGDPVPGVYTDANGLYLFDNLLPGYYYMKFTPPAGYDFTTQYGTDDTTADSDAWYDGWTDLFSVFPGDGDTIADTDGATTASFVNPTIDAGFVPPRVAVGNYTWFDSDLDGVQDPDEAPIPNVYVELLNPDGTEAVDADGYPVGGVYTDENGYYSFDWLEPGNYKMRFTLPDGLTFTTPTASGAADADDSDAVPTADPSVGLTGVFTLSASVTGNMLADDADDFWASFVDPTIDAGVIPPVVAVGNYTWIDTNRDGIQDADEPAISGVFVELFDENGDPAVDANGDLVPGVYTDADGLYLFDNLLPGSYYMKFTPPTGYDFTSAYEGADSAVDSNAWSDGWTDLFTILPGDGETINDDDPSTVATFVNPTIDAGFVFLPVAVGNYVWYDLDSDGIQDPDEDPIEGVYVELLNPDGTPATDINGDPVPGVYTDGDGRYLFDNLAPGQYKVRFTLPDDVHYGFTTRAAGNDPFVDSTANRYTGETAVFSVIPGVGATFPDVNPDTVAEFINPTIDAGVVPIVAISNYFWFDSNRDGIRDPDEVPVEGGEVRLLDADGNPAIDADGNPVAPVFADENGYFRFDNLYPGSYRLQFIPPAGYGFTVKSDSIAEDDSNVNPNGITDVFEVLGRSEYATAPEDDVESFALFVNPTVGAGLVQVVAVGNYTWIDSDADGQQDADEVPVAGVKVELLNADGTPALDSTGQRVAAVFTDAAGRYLFDGLLPGDYRIRFTPPSGLGFTSSLTGDDTTDSNADAITGLTPVFTLTADSAGNMSVDRDSDTLAVFVDRTIDAGFVLLELPATGSGSARQLLLLGLFMIVIGGSVCVSVRRGRRL